MVYSDVRKSSCTERDGGNVCVMFVGFTRKGSLLHFAHTFTQRAVMTSNSLMYSNPLSS